MHCTTVQEPKTFWPSKPDLQNLTKIKTCMIFKCTHTTQSYSYINDCHMQARETQTVVETKAQSSCLLYSTLQDPIILCLTQPYKTWSSCLLLNVTWSTCNYFDSKHVGTEYLNDSIVHGLTFYMYMYYGAHVIYMHDRCTTCICVQHVTIIDNLLSDSSCKSTTKVRSLFWSHFLHSCYGIKVVINGCTSPSFFHTYIADYWCCVCMGSS